MASLINYAELCAKTHYTFLEGASRPEDMIEQAARLDYHGMAICDRNGVYGLPKAYGQSKLHPELKFICGAELSIDGVPLYFLAKNRNGYGAICQLITKAYHAHGQSQEKGLALLQWSHLQDCSDRLQHMICMISPLSTPPPMIQQLKELFCDFNFLITHDFRGWDQIHRNDTIAMSQKWDIPFVASQQPLYHIREKAPLHDVLRAIRHQTSLDKMGFQSASNQERYLKTVQELHHIYRHTPEAIERTIHISDRCEFSMNELRYRYPNEWIPAEQTPYAYLNHLVWQGAKMRYPNGIPEAVSKQLQHELELIRTLQYEDYFLTIYDIVEFARSRKILCQGRGSAANSAVCYTLGITAIDPVQMNLLFERFISMERKEPPDIDVDFEHERREEVIQYLYQKYGRDRAAMVATTITYRSRGALRDVAKALGVPVGTLSAKALAKDIEQYTQQSTIKDCGKHLTRMVEEIRGTPRHLGIHSGGFTLSADPITEIVPVEPARMPGRTIIQWDKYDLDELGLLKIDVLSLGMLSALRRCLDTVGLELHEIPADDKATYEMIQQADTVGTFQIESRAQMSMLGRLKPQTFYDLVVEVAIVRPGPIVGQMVHPYLRRRQGLEPITYPHPKLKSILHKTLGVPLFQEQVMKMAIEVAGFTPGEADQLRRSINAWRGDGRLHYLGRKLEKGLLENGVPIEYCQRIFVQIQGFAEYGFPESHAASFALLAYASCYLKRHYPAEFCAALLNSQPMGFYPPHALIDDARRHGVAIAPISVQNSKWESFMEFDETSEKKLRLGLHLVRGLSQIDAEQIMHAQPFRDLKDFLLRVPLRRDQRMHLALGNCLQDLVPQANNAFQSEQQTRREILWTLLRYEVTETLPHAQVPEVLSQESSKAEFRTMSLFEQITADYEHTRSSAEYHPMAGLRSCLDPMILRSSQVKRLPSGKRFLSAGMILVRQRPPTAHGVTFCTLEDEDGYLDLIVHKAVFERFQDEFLYQAFLKIEGILQKDGNTHSIIVKSAQALLQAPELYSRSRAHYF